MLVEGGEAHARSWADALRVRGVTVPMERIRPLVGLNADQLLLRLTGIPLRSPLGARVDRARKLLFRHDHLPALRPHPRLRELLERFRSMGLRLGAVSAVGREDLLRLLQIAGVAGLLETSLSVEDARSEAAVADVLETLEVDPEAALMIADNPHDLSAAVRSGVDAVALRTGGWNDRALSAAAAVYEDPADLLERLDESPLAYGSAGESDSRRA